MSESEMSDNRIDQVYQYLNKIEGETGKTSRVVDEIFKLLKGDDFGSPGVVTRLGRAEKEIQVLRDREMSDLRDEIKTEIYNLREELLSHHSSLRSRVDRIYHTAGIIAFVVTLITTLVSVNLF